MALIVLIAFQTRHKPPPQAADATPVALAGTTKLPLSSGVFLPLVCEPALGDLRFVDPVQAVPLPAGSGRLVIVERTGRLMLVDPHTSPPSKSLLLDLTPQLQLTPNQAEEGVLGLAFHPQFANSGSTHRGELFVYYTAKTDAGPSNRLSRFRVVRRPFQAVENGTAWKGRPTEITIDPASKQVLIDQPDQMQAHNGGGLAFGPDGFLYLGIGDDASPQPNENAQVVSRHLFSGILRIDVDCRGGAISRPPNVGQVSNLSKTEKGQVENLSYFIPLDNPFLGIPGAREEFYAIGLRNPWRMSFDRLTGRLYAGDPGDRRREEINLVDAGANCGWAYAEGTLLTASFDRAARGRPEKYVGRETWPIFEYQRDVAHRCVIGGHVYRGRQFPELYGSYLYADQSGRIYALQLSADGRQVHAQKLLAVVPDIVIGISSLDVDALGELLIATIGDLGQETGQVFRLRRTEPSEQMPLPPTLADTSLFADWRKLTPRESLVSYDVNVPLWSDGAEKRRWIAVPPGQAVEFAGGGNFRYPAGTVFVKHFELATDERQPAVRRPLETRVLVVDDRHEVFGLTYRWSADGKRTRPVTQPETETIDITQSDGSQRQQVWHYPGRFDCLMCHNESAGYVLGFVPKQLLGQSSGFRVQGSGFRGRRSEVRGQRTGDRGQETRDELTRLSDCGVIRPCTDPAELAKIAPLVPLVDESAPLTQRVRSYLDVNCSMCHNPGLRFAAFDTRVERPIEEQGLIEGHAYHHSDFSESVRIVKSGDLAESMLYLRLTSREPHLRMPPLGSTVVDEQARQTIAEWIKTRKPIVEVVERPTRE